MKKTYRAFHATGPEAGVSITLHPAGVLLIRHQQDVSPLECAGLLSLIDSRPAGTRWQVRVQEIPPALHASLHDPFVITLHPEDGPPMAAFCRRRVTRRTAEAVLAALPEISVVGYPEGLLFRDSASRPQPSPTPPLQPSTRRQP